MQSLTAVLSANRTVTIAVMAAIVLVTLAVIFRARLFGARLNMGGSGRARQPRLGVVDAFDLDRQRQLVLIRRDNVEHLVMIGGPNDLLIEPAIVRAAPVQGREKDGVAVTPPVIPVATPSPASVPEPQVMPAPAPAKAPEPVQDAVPPRPEPAPQPPVATPRPGPAPVRASSAPPFRQPGATPATPRPLTTARTPIGSLPPRPTPVIPRPSPLSRVTSAAATRRDEAGAESGAATASETPSSLAPTEPGPAAPPEAAVPAAASPVGDVAPPVPEVATATPPTDPQPAPPRAAPPNIPATLDTLESLEEEMAKLLGRSVGDKG